MVTFALVKRQKWILYEFEEPGSLNFVEVGKMKKMRGQGGLGRR